MIASEARRAARTVVRRPALAASLVVTVAFGIGATTSVFGVIYAVLLRAISGAAVGLGCVLFTTRLASTLLFGVAPADIGVLATVSVLLIGTAFVAMLAPTVRASRVSPLIAMTPDS